MSTYHEPPSFFKFSLFFDVMDSTQLHLLDVFYVVFPMTLLLALVFILEHANTPINNTSQEVRLSLDTHTNINCSIRYYEHNVEVFHRVGRDDYQFRGVRL